MRNKRSDTQIRAAIEAAAGDVIHYSILGYWWVYVKLPDGRIHQAARRNLVRLESEVLRVLESHKA